MKVISRFKVDSTFSTLLFIIAVISVIAISSAEVLIPAGKPANFAIKQAMWYSLGFAAIYIIMFLGNDFLFKNAWIFYIIGVFLLFFLLIAPESIARPVNGAKCWFQIPGIGTFQPSEFMKIFLILLVAKILNDFNETHFEPTVKDEFVLIMKVLGVTAVPAFLTFLQPDSGVVLIMLIIVFAMLFVSGIRIRWFVMLFGLGLFVLLTILALYAFNFELFIKIFGSEFLYRIQRLLDWQNQEGFQLENAWLAMGSSGLWGHGIGAYVNYFPEPQTDFIFAVIVSNVGFFGTITFLGILTLFDIKVINIGRNSVHRIGKYAVGGIMGMIIYQQLQNIGMTLGVLPITGITLPFISYGGTSLLSYMVMMGIVFNISNENIRYTN